MQVRFLQRCGAYWPGADPVLEAVEAARLIASGVCVPFDSPAPPAPVAAPVDVEGTPDEPTDLEPINPPTAAIRKRGRRS